MSGEIAMKKILWILCAGLAALVVGITAAGLLYRPEGKIPEGFVGRYVEANGIRLRVLQEGAGPDVLLIHGCPGSVEDWAPLMETLSKNHRVTAYDRPGHGFSIAEGLPYTITHNAQTARALIAALGLKDVVVVGHSYGAMTTLALALEKPSEVKGYVVVGPSPYGIHNIDPLYRLLVVPGFGTGFARILGPLLGPEKIREGLLQSFGPNVQEIPAGFIDFRVRLWSRPMVALARAHEVLNFNSDVATLAPHYREIAGRVFLVEGAEEKYAPDVRKLHGEISGSEWVEMPGVGHEVPVVRPKELAGVIEQVEGRGDRENFLHP
jgi:pimeloyl-ACP methyl ester carboxylesterase